MKTGSYLYAVLILFLIFGASCETKKEDTGRLQAEQLYKDLMQTLNQCADSLEAAKDSTRVYSIADKLSDEMTDMYFKYSPEAALRLSEAENDKLSAMTDSILSLRDSLLYRFANPVVPADSISSDTIPIVATIE